MDEGQNLNNGGSGLGAAGGFDAFQNNNTFQNAGVGGGDIVIASGDNDGGQKSRKRLLLGVAAVVVVFALVAVGVFAMWKGGVFSGGKSRADISSAIKNEYDNAKSLEDFFGHVYGGDVSFEMMYGNEDSVGSLGQSIESFDEFNNKIRSIEERDLSNKDKNAFVKLREISERRIDLYNEFNKLVTTFYQVYGLGSVTQELLSNSDKNIASLAVQFNNYFAKRGQLILDIDVNGCGSWLEQNDVCTNLYDEYYANEDFITDGLALKNIAESILSVDSYGEYHELTNLMNEILLNNGVMMDA